MVGFRLLNRLQTRPTAKQQLLLAIVEERADNVKQILAGKPSLVLHSSSKKPTDNLLHVAAAVGNGELVDELLGALYRSLHHKSALAGDREVHKVVNCRNRLGQTPLMLACKAGSERCARLLLGAGADPCLWDSQSQSTCLHYAAQFGWAGVIDVLLGDDLYVTVAAGGGRRTQLRHALVPDAKGLQKYLDGRSALDLTPLHLAITHGHQAAAAALIKWGAALTSRCNLFLSEGQGSCIPHSTPAHLAAAKGDSATTLLLLREYMARVQRHGVGAGPDPRMLLDYLGRRPLDVAQIAGHTDLLDVLNPDHPLPEVLDPPSARIPQLSALAVHALRQQLTCQLDRLAVQHAERAAADLGARCACPICLEDQAVDGPVGLAESRPHCWQLVAVAGCRHTMCLGCARELCARLRAGDGGLLHCPLCRGVIGSWAPVSVP